ncbi:MAG: Electron-transferring-flavoprotein dehydrogenase [Frankiales bacterium]|nr:Electron-transferring-flavoprotein dehydrogenase [Frankiales bacterium]
MTDVIVVGAGPAGASAALTAARAGLEVVLLERGPFPGSKNAYGGVVYGRVLDDVLPGWYDEVPVQRWVTRRSTMVLTDTQALTVDFRSTAWGEAPYNGCTTFRADFDSWLANKAVEAGAQLVTSTVATGLLVENGVVVGVTTDRPDGDLRAKVVIAADGVNSFLAKQLGLLPKTDAAHLTLGVKEVLSLPREVIDERFGVRGDEGVDVEILGCTRGIAGGGFVYTNKDSLSVGVVVSIDGLAKSGIRPEELIADLKAHPAVAPWVQGAEVKEYAAHLIPEGGYDHLPELSAPGFLVTGDAAGLCLAAGIWLEGVNFAIGSGLAAGKAAAGHVQRDEPLTSYKQDLEGSFVLQDHKRLRKAPGLVLSDRVQQQYPGMIADLVEGMFTVTNPTAKPGVLTLLRRSAKKHGVKLRHLAADGLSGGRTFR